jgi:hypothetical protein
MLQLNQNQNISTQSNLIIFIPNFCQTKKIFLTHTHFLSSRMFPHFYYNQSWLLPDDKVLEILLLDTTILCGNTYDTPYGKRLKGPDNVHDANLQWSWLERSLKGSK